MSSSEAEAPWRVVGALAVSETVAWGVLYYSFGVLLRPFAEHLAVPEAVIAGAFSVALLCSGAATWIGGKSVDRWGPRPVMTFGAALGLASFACLGMVHSIRAFYVVWAAIGLSHACVLYEPAFAAIAKWFPSAPRRARALLVLTSVAGLASTIFVPLTAALYEHVGRRWTILILAVLVGTIVLPLNASLPKRRANVASIAQLSVPRASIPRRKPHLGALGIVFALQAFASAGVSVHLVSHLRESGFALSSAAMITGFMGAAQVPARLLFCQFQRVVSTRARLPLLLVVQAVSLVGVLGRTDVVVTCSVLLFGAASGLMTLERAMLIADSFGADEYGAVSGRLATFALATRAGAPVAVGVVRMATSYAVAFLALAILTALAGAILWTALREENETQWRRS